MPHSPRCADLAEQPRRPILGISGRFSAAERPLPEPRAAGTAEAGGRSVLEGPVTPLARGWSQLVGVMENRAGVCATVSRMVHSKVVCSSRSCRTSFTSHHKLHTPSARAETPHASTCAPHTTQRHEHASDETPRTRPRRPPLLGACQVAAARVSERSGQSAGRDGRRGPMGGSWVSPPWPRARTAPSPPPLGISLGCGCAGERGGGLAAGGSSGGSGAA